MADVDDLAYIEANLRVLYAGDISTVREMFDRLLRDRRVFRDGERQENPRYIEYEGQMYYAP